MAADGWIGFTGSLRRVPPGSTPRFDGLCLTNYAPFLLMRRLSFSVRDELAGRITSGAIPPGSRLPPEPQLAEDFGVSRATLREALRSLEEDGFVTRRRGAGTFATHRPRLRNNLDVNFGVTEAIRASGMRSRDGRHEGGGRAGERPGGLGARHRSRGARGGGRAGEDRRRATRRVLPRRRRPRHWSARTRSRGWKTDPCTNFGVVCPRRDPARRRDDRADGRRPLPRAQAARSPPGRCCSICGRSTTTAAAIRSCSHTSTTSAMRSSSASSAEVLEGGSDDDRQDDATEARDRPGGCPSSARSTTG